MADQFTELSSKELEDLFIDDWTDCVIAAKGWVNGPGIFFAMRAYIKEMAEEKGYEAHYCNDHFRDWAEIILQTAR